MPEENPTNIDSHYFGRSGLMAVIRELMLTIKGFGKIQDCRIIPFF
jgi:hypothetical protein